MSVLRLQLTASRAALGIIDLIGRLPVHSRRVPARQPADEAAGGGHGQGPEGGERSQEQYGTGAVGLGLVHGRRQLAAGLARAELCKTQPGAPSRGSVSSASQRHSVLYTPGINLQEVLLTLGLDNRLLF